MRKPVLCARMYFSYGQFMVYDPSELPGLDWTEEHFSQGFTRRDSQVAFGTLEQFGFAQLRVLVCPYEHADHYQRVIAVPFKAVSGRILIEGPEEFDTNRAVEAVPGVYRLVAAQTLIGDEEEEIDLFVERLEAALGASQIIKADDDLQPEYPLLEHADIAGA